MKVFRKPTDEHMEVSIQKEKTKREWTGRYILQIDGDEVGTFPNIKELKARLNIERETRELPWKNVHVQTHYKGGRRGKDV